MSTTNTLEMRMLTLEGNCPGRHNGVNLAAVPDMMWEEFFAYREAIADNIRRDWNKRPAKTRVKPRYEKLRVQLQSGGGQDAKSNVYRRLTSPQTAEGTATRRSSSCYRSPAWEELTTQQNQFDQATSSSWYRGTSSEAQQLEEAERERYLRSSHQNYPVSGSIPNLRTDKHIKVLLPTTTRNSSHEPIYSSAQYSSVEKTNDEAKALYNKVGTWLDGMLIKPATFDISRKAFFDGTAIPDGYSGLLIQDFVHPCSPLDMWNPENRKHKHETSAGFAYNYRSLCAELNFAHNEEAKQPHSEIAYIRFARYCDVKEIQKIFKYYYLKSFMSPHPDPNERTVQELILNCAKTDLPFIVAVAPEYGSDGRPTAKERVMGYACVSLFDEKSQTMSLTGNLEVFVAPEYLRRKVGESLVDTILILCSPDYRHRTGLPYKWHEESLLSDAWLKIRDLKTLLCGLAYPAGLEWEIEWIAKWLKTFEFEDQGVFNQFSVRKERT